MYLASSSRSEILQTLHFLLYIIHHPLCPIRWCAQNIITRCRRVWRRVRRGGGRVRRLRPIVVVPFCFDLFHRLFLSEMHDLFRSRLTCIGHKLGKKVQRRQVNDCGYAPPKKTCRTEFMNPLRFGSCSSCFSFVLVALDDRPKVLDQNPLRF